MAEYGGEKPPESEIMESAPIVEEIPLPVQRPLWKESPPADGDKRGFKTLVEENALTLFHDSDVTCSQHEITVAGTTIVINDEEDRTERKKAAKKASSPRATSKSKQDALQIKTPQALIHIRHSISLLQYKYWILMIHEMRRQLAAGILPDDSGFRSISFADIAAAINYTPNKSELWDDMQALKNETIAYNVLGKDGQPAKYGSGFITEWKVYSTRLEFKFPSFIEDVVRGLEEPRAIFQILNWEIFNHFSGKYEAIIYKFCRDYRGVKKTPYQTLDEFRNYMGLETHEYKEFRDLNKYVISGPVKTINESAASDIKVEVDFERQGRKVLGLRFLIEPKAQMALEADEGSEAFRFAKVYIDPALQRKYLALRNDQEIKLCIQRANEYGETQALKGTVPNYGALYRTAIQDGWHIEQLELQMQEEKRTERRRAIESQQEGVKASHDAKAAEELAKVNRIMDAFASLPENRQQEIRTEFRRTITTQAIRTAFDKSGEQSPIVRAAFAKFVQEMVADSAVDAKPARKTRANR